MQKLNFKIEIKAPASKVYDNMLGISNKETYDLWAAMFDPTSFYEGSWEKGAEIVFICINKQGQKEGMLAKIKENIPNKFVSIRYYGFLSGGIKVTETEEIKSWGDALENYSFEENNSITTVTVDVDTKEEYVDFFNVSWVKALNKLKEICEK